MTEILAPAGNMEKLKTALHFGADAVYLSYKEYGLRAFTDNFDEKGLEEAIKFVHSMGKKVYITLNILAHNRDFARLAEFLTFLNALRPDGVLVSDLGMLAFVKKYAYNVPLHISTQASVTNKYAASQFADMGARRIVMARELSIDEIKEIRDFIPADIEIEAFVHGAMCISYSGRCLLSNYMANRPSNHGECAQCCRWEYAVAEKTRGEYMPIEEDERGTYIFNSKDLNTIRFVDKLIKAGIDSFKIEGRVKSVYYVAGAVNAYRRAVDIYNKNPESFVLPQEIADDLEKIGNRGYCTGFYFGNGSSNETYDTSKPTQTYDFIAKVIDTFDGGAVCEMRGRFKKGDILEVLSPADGCGKEIEVKKLQDLNGAEMEEVTFVQQQFKLYTDIKLLPDDILRRKA